MLGLEEGAEVEDIKLAYREMAQILHPDKFSGNRRLAIRAEQQFKRLNEARDVLMAAAGQPVGKERGSRGAGSRGAVDDRSAVLRARLSGLASARIQLVSQLEHEQDSRRVACGLFIGGLIALFIGDHFTMLLIDALGGSALVWGAIQAIGTQQRIKAIREHIQKLAKQRKEYEAELAEL